MNEEKIDGKSLDISEEKKNLLKQLFPEVFTEGDKINFERLRLTLGEMVDAGKERFGLTWAGKADCFRAIQTPSTGTLLPCREESVDFDTTENLYIEGDNLEVLKLLQKPYLGKIKMIYIDPPYNTGNDFIYPDNYSESLETYLEYTGQTDENGRRFSTNQETDGRFHSKWLNMMYPRLFLARNLLREDGVIFISIDDSEQSNLKKICDEIFGEENFVATFPWRKRTAKADVPFGVSQDFEWVVAYCKSEFKAGVSIQRKYFSSDDYKSGWRLADLTTQRNAQERPNSNFTLINPKNGNEYPANPNRVWSVTKETFDEYYAKGKIVFPGDYDFLKINKPAYRVFEDEDRQKNFLKFNSDEARKSISTLLPSDVGRTEDGTAQIIELFDYKIFGFPKPYTLLKYFLNIIPDDDFLVLDFFSGSATTAHAVLDLNKQDGGSRKFILVQLPEPCDENSEAYKAGFKTIAEIGKERIRRVINKIKEEKAQPTVDALINDEKPLDLGFKVMKLASSNFKKWNKTTETTDEELIQTLDEMLDNIIDNRTQEDILYEILLKSGFQLSTTVETLTLAGKTVYSVAERMMLICLEDTLTIDVIRAMAELQPNRVVCLDTAFENNDQLKTNAVKIMEAKKVERFITV